MCEAMCEFHGTAANWATMSVLQARNPRLRPINTQTSGLGENQMRAADVAQARLVLSEATLREAESDSDSILRVVFLHSKICIFYKRNFCNESNNHKAALTHSCSYYTKINLWSFFL